MLPPDDIFTATVQRSVGDFRSPTFKERKDKGKGKKERKRRRVRRREKYGKKSEKQKKREGKERRGSQSTFLATPMAKQHGRAQSANLIKPKFHYADFATISATRC